MSMAFEDRKNPWELIQRPLARLFTNFAQFWCKIFLSKNWVGISPESQGEEKWNLFGRGQNLLGITCLKLIRIFSNRVNFKMQKGKWQIAPSLWPFPNNVCVINPLINQWNLFLFFSWILHVHSLIEYNFKDQADTNCFLKYISRNVNVWFSKKFALSVMFVAYASKPKAQLKWTIPTHEWLEWTRPMI